MSFPPHRKVGRGQLFFNTQLYRKLQAGLRIEEQRLRMIRLACAPMFVSQSLDRWAYRKRLKWDLSGPGKPTTNALIESFNGSLHQRCLNQHWFLSLSVPKTLG